MQAESNIKPSKKFILENYIDNNVDIVFFDDIKKEDREIYNEDGNVKIIEVYVYKTYRITKRYRDTLEQDIKDNYLEYLEQAKKYEKKGSRRSVEEREWRNAELDKTDKYLLEDYPSKYSKQTILEYREALRTYPEEDGFPYDAIRPKIEDFI